MIVSEKEIEITRQFNVDYIRELEKSEGIAMTKSGKSKKKAVVRVATEERAAEILDLCEANGMKVIIGIEPDKPEDIYDVQKLLGIKVENTKTIVNDVSLGRNDPCTCMSGKKYKKCCGKNF